MAQLFKNNAFSSLGATLTNVATTLTVASSHGDRFPVVEAPDFMMVTLQDASNNIEIVKVTARASGADTMTIQRAQEGTTARSWAIGDVVELRLTAQALNPLALLEGSSTAAAIRTNLGATTVGGNVFTLTNPSAITFLRINADNTVSALSAANFRTAIGTGDVNGPVSATDNAVARYDLATGKLLQDSPVTISDDGDVEGVASINGGQLAGLRNKIINGKMEIAQRGTSFVGVTATSFHLDRWLLNDNSSAVFTISQSADVPAGNEFQSSLRAEVTTADSSLAVGENAAFVQLIEGYNARDLIGRTFTLSFWVRSSKTGAHCIALRNLASDRAYVAEYTVSVANTWEKKAITVSGGLITAGTWDWTNGIGLRVWFVMAAESVFHTTAGAWQTGNFLATSSQVNCLDTIGNIFAITGVQLEVGSAATPFEHRPYGMELALCQRYYHRMAAFGAGHRLAASGRAVNAETGSFVVVHPVTMRTAPLSMEQSGGTTDYSIAYGVSIVDATTVPAYAAPGCGQYTVISCQSSGWATGDSLELRANSANAFLGFSAEL